MRWSRRLVRTVRYLRDRAGALGSKPGNRLIDSAPSDQVAIDLFAGAWASHLPVDGLASGAALLFQDDRIAWLLDGIGDLSGMQVLELGPLEGGHTSMLLERGVAQVTAIEANADAFLRCLVAKNILGLDRAKFLLGNFERFLAARERRFDLVLASGVFYHLVDPLPVILDLVGTTDRIAIWSQFFAPRRDGDGRGPSFSGRRETRTIGADRLTYHEHVYGASRLSTAFLGGVRPTSSWLELHEVVALLERHGYRVTVRDEPYHPAHGASASILALR